MSQVIVETKNIVKDFETRRGLLQQILGQRSQVNRAVDGVSISLRRSEILAVVGESGCGKTTFGRIICLLEAPTAGSLVLDGEDVSGVSGGRALRLRRKVQMVFQNPYDSLDPRGNVRSLIEQPLQLQGFGSRGDRRDATLRMLDSVGLRPPSAFANRYPHELSGGQRQRVAIARAMIVGPKVVVADEPVSMLDVSIRSGILSLMLELREKTGAAFVFITHDLSVARYVADRIAVMYLGQVAELGPSDTLVRSPVHPYTRLLLAAVPRLHGARGTGGRRRARVRTVGEAADSGGLPIQGCKFAPRCPLSTLLCTETCPTLVLRDGGSAVACHRARKLSEMTTDALIEMAAEMKSEPTGSADGS